MTRKLIFAVLSTLITALSASNSLRADVPYTAPNVTWIKGTGGFSCSKFLDYKQNHPNEMDFVVQWVWGFLSAYNMRGHFGTKSRDVANLSDIPDSETIVLFLSNYCNGNSLAIVEGGAVELIKQLHGDKNRAWCS
jgi:hypothetical protein